jgi:hypothetical protein
MSYLPVLTNRVCLSDEENVLHFPNTQLLKEDSVATSATTNGNRSVAGTYDWV